MPIILKRVILYTLAGVMAAGITAVMLIPGSAEAEYSGLVQCEGPDCNYCTLIGTLFNVLNWLKVIAASIAAIAIMYGGFKMLTSAGNQSGYEEGKKFVTNAVLGLIVLMVAVTAVDVLIQALVKDEHRGKFSVHVLWHPAGDCGGMTYTKTGTPDEIDVDETPPIAPAIPGVNTNSIACDTVLFGTLARCGDAVQQCTDGGGIDIDDDDPSNVTCATPANDNTELIGCGMFSCSNQENECTSDGRSAQVVDDNYVVCSSNPPPSRNDEGGVDIPIGCAGIMMPGGVCVGGEIPMSECTSGRGVVYSGKCYSTPSASGGGSSDPAGGGTTFSTTITNDAHFNSSYIAGIKDDIIGEFNISNSTVDDWGALENSLRPICRNMGGYSIYVSGIDGTDNSRAYCLKY